MDGLLVVPVLVEGEGGVDLGGVGGHGRVQVVGERRVRLVKQHRAAAGGGGGAGQPGNGREEQT